MPIPPSIPLPDPPLAQHPSARSAVRFAAALVIALVCGFAVAPRASAQTPPASPPTAVNAAAAGTAFTAAQRAEIVEVIRSALKTDPSILRDAVVALQSDEASRRQGAAAAAIVSAGPQLARSGADEVAGNPAGDVTVVEFYDPRCPYCRRMLPIESEILRADPRLRWVYKEIPVLGPASVLGTRAILAAQKQGKYDAMHDALMSGTPEITPVVIHAAADRAGIDWARLERDMNDPAVQSRIEANLALARRLEIEGTPAFVIGDKLLPGAVDLATLRDMVAAARAP